jgi:hypothetical protein
VSVHGPLWLYFEPQKLSNLDLNADPDPAFHSNADLDVANVRYLLVSDFGDQCLFVV